MSDEQLQRFARLEAENLSLPAFHALKDELTLRNIDLSIIEELEDVDVPERVVNNAITGDFVTNLFQFILEEQLAGTSNAEIYQKLLAKNIGSEQALMLLDGFDKRCEIALKDVENEIVVGWVILLIGLIACAFAWEGLQRGFFVGVVALIVGGVKLARSYQNKSKLILARKISRLILETEP